MKNQERLPITFVTTKDGNNKAAIFQRSLPNWTISHREPLYNEDKIHETAPHTEMRPQIIAEQKARADIALAQAISGVANAIVEDGDLYTAGNEKMLLYTDTVQMVHVNATNDKDVVMLEKPVGDPIEWATNSPEAVIQSGKDIEIVNALSGVKTGKDGVSEPAMVVLRVRATMKSFTREDVIAYAKNPNNTIAHTSGGLSMSNGARSFLDESKPLTVSVGDSMDTEPVEIVRYNTWDHLTKDDLKPFICGAFEPAITKLVEKVTK